MFLCTTNGGLVFRVLGYGVTMFRRPMRPFILGYRGVGAMMAKISGGLLPERVLCRRFLLASRMKPQCALSAI